LGLAGVTKILWSENKEIVTGSKITQNIDSFHSLNAELINYYFTDGFKIIHL